MKSFLKSKVISMFEKEKIEMSEEEMEVGVGDKP